jgi:transcriptional regulator with XRE-family HTH domain
MKGNRITPRLGRKMASAHELTIDKALGCRLHDARIRAGLSMEQLGRTVGLSYQQIQKYEAGKNRIPVARMLAFAKTLNVAPAAFIEGLVDVDGAALPPLLSRSENALLAAARRNPPSHVGGFTAFLNFLADGADLEMARKLQGAADETAKRLAETPPAELIQRGPIELNVTEEKAA